MNINPEKVYQRVPELGATSKIIGLDKSEYRSGIIFDNTDDLFNGLRVYNNEGGSAAATQRRVREDVGNDQGIAGLGVLSMAEMHSGRGSFVDDVVIPRINEEMQQRKNKGFYISFDYDGMGTNFMKTSLSGKVLNEKVVLEICAAYVGDRPEGELAERLGKIRALESANIVAKLSIVDDWWFNINMPELFSQLPVKKDLVSELIKYTIETKQQGYYNMSNITFDFEDEVFELSVGFNYNSYLRPENAKSFKDNYETFTSDSILGAAWTVFAEDGNTSISPKPENPTMIVRVKKCKGAPAITQENISKLQRARDYLSKQINLS